MTPDQKKEHARQERIRRANWTPEQREKERKRSNRRYAEGKKNPEWLRRKRAQGLQGMERLRRRRGVPLKNWDPLKLRRKQRNSRPYSRLIKNLRRRVLSALQGKNKSQSTLALIGCSVVELRRHLQNKFQLGMTWENYGPVWHVDHKKPCAAFDLTDPAKQRACFHWTNLQPMFASDNLRKGAKVSLGE